MKKAAIITAIALGFATLTAHAAPPRFFGQTEQSYVNKADYGNNQAAGQYVQSGDARIYYEVYGKGSPVVVLHGGMVGSPAEMGELIDHLLADNHQVIAINTRGHGKSETGKVAPSYAQKSQDVAAVLAKVTSDPMDIIGFSGGGYTGYQFAADYPDKIKKLVAIGAGQWIKGGSRSFNSHYDLVEKLDPAYWAEQAKLRPEPAKTADWIESCLAYYNSVEFGKAEFAKVKVPTLVLAGENDLNAPLDTVISAYKMLPNARLSCRTLHTLYCKRILRRFGQP